MAAPPVESMSVAANPQILVANNDFQQTIIIKSSTSETNNVIKEDSVKESEKSINEQNRLKSTNEVFDLIKSEIKQSEDANKTVSRIDISTQDSSTKLKPIDLVASPRVSVDIQNFNTELPKTPKISIPTAKRTVLEEHGFTVGNQIGAGTYAKVKIGYSMEHKGPVAIKIISKMKAPSDYLKRFLPREIEVVKGLHHENLIKFYQSIETTHRVYIIMQLAEKGSLLDLIRKEKRLDDFQTRKYFCHLINAVDYCHSQGVVHRDIKCENLLLDKDFNLKLIDFGFARGHMHPVNNSPILSETYCGSYAYASPEVLKGIPYDPHMSDIWATGVVLFAMVYGRFPYDGSSYNNLLKQVQGKLTFPKNPDDIPAGCKNLIQKVLAPLKTRYKVRQIRQDPWFNNEE